MEKWFGLLFVAAGLFSIAGGVFDWDWFMESRNARIFVTILGRVLKQNRTGARILYVLLGAALCTLGVIATLGVVDLSKK